MKKRLSFCLVLLVALCVAAAALAVEGAYTWRGNAVTVTAFDRNPMFVPANMGNDEYAVTVYADVDEALWKDDALWDEMYAEVRMVDDKGTAYAPQAGGKGTDKPFFSFSFCIPKAVDADALTFVTEAAGSADAPAQSANAPAQSDALELATASGDALTLTPAENGAFAAQEDKVIVHTRIGTTVHNSGSQFLAGSGLKLSNMRNTKQYEMPMVAFAYQTSLDFDAAADAIGEIGQAATLTLDGTNYPVQVAWITKDLACFVFNCPALPSGTPRFTSQDGALVIEP